MWYSTIMSKLKQGQPTIQVEASFPASRPEKQRVTRRINVPESVWRNLSADDPDTAQQNRHHIAIRFERAANLKPRSVRFGELVLHTVASQIEHPLPPPPPRYTPQPEKKEAPPEHQLAINFGDDFAREEIEASRLRRPTGHYSADITR